MGWGRRRRRRRRRRTTTPTVPQYMITSALYAASALTPNSEKLNERFEKRAGEKDQDMEWIDMNQTQRMHSILFLTTPSMMLQGWHHPCLKQDDAAEVASSFFRQRLHPLLGVVADDVVGHQCQ